uniref:Uncharacterized protein n=1 Tax=Arundo donax TaxID=35708 RepID=A0A0A9C128_ARUDO
MGDISNLVQPDVKCLFAEFLCTNLINKGLQNQKLSLDLFHAMLKICQYRCYFSHLCANLL